MNQFQHIRECCSAVVQLNVKLCRMATLDWIGYGYANIVANEGATQPKLGDGVKLFVPRECSALGAVLFCHGNEFSKTPWSNLQAILGVSSHWLYRFTIGWGQRTVLHAAITNKSGDIVDWTEDDVSRAARDLLKELVRP